MDLSLKPICIDYFLDMHAMLTYNYPSYLYKKRNFCLRIDFAIKK